MKQIQIINKDDNKMVIKSDSKLGRSIFLSLLKQRDMIEEANVKEEEFFKFRAPLFISLDIEDENGKYNKFLVGPNIFLDVDNLNLYKINGVKKNLKSTPIDIDFNVSKCCITAVDDCMVNIVSRIKIPYGKNIRLQICASDKGPIDCVYNTKTDDFYFVKRWSY